MKTLIHQVCVGIQTAILDRAGTRCTGCVPEAPVIEEQLKPLTDELARVKSLLKRYTDAEKLKTGGDASE